MKDRASDKMLNQEGIRLAFEQTGALASAALEVFKSHQGWISHRSDRNMPASQLWPILTSFALPDYLMP